MGDSNVVIRVEGLGKKYAIHHEKGERNTTLRDVVARQAKSAGRLLNPFTLAGQLRKAQREAAVERAESEEDFWALKDVSFEIRRGERVGIIGRNGAGKSTLLKILSRITEPTTGRVEILGRVASLLEVGTGFHPELTGRENIFLNGAILGMTRREIGSKFDEIVDFAEVEKFLDTPVKRYSSGMYVRLAFAVAAHLEPEILVVDEVLAVGDARFRTKCLSQMNKVSTEEGRTIVFVSHDIPSLRSICNSSILIENGCIKIHSSTDIAISSYLKSLSTSRLDLGCELFDIQGIRIAAEAHETQINFEILAHSEPISCNFWFALRSTSDNARCGYLSAFNQDPLRIFPGINSLSCRLDTSHLKPGVYEVIMSIQNLELTKELLSSIQIGVVTISSLPPFVLNQQSYSRVSANLPCSLISGQITLIRPGDYPRVVF